MKSDDAFTWLVGDLEVGRFALTELRVSHGEALLSLMADILGALVHQGLLRLDTVALDGTRVRASASAPSFRSLRSLQECREQALLHVHAVLADADNPEISARQQAAAEAAACDILRRTVRSNGGGDRDGDEARGGGGTKAQRRGRRSAPRRARRSGARASTTDAEARVMKMPDGGFRPGYFQFAVAGKDTGGPRTIVDSTSSTWAATWAPSRR